MAALFAKSNNWNDALLLNTADNICDSSIANIFLIKNGLVTTPGLDSGCIAGVMRRTILEQLPACGLKIKETSINVNDILTADEVFLSNSIYGIRWIKQIRNVQYNNTLTRQIYKLITTHLS
jgi:branched-chain amino acid aminotransferase